MAPATDDHHCRDINDGCADDRRAGAGYEHDGERTDDTRANDSGLNDVSADHEHDPAQYDLDDAPQHVNDEADNEFDEG